MKPQVAIFSASSQVGSSVALYLHLFEKARVIAYSRSQFPAVFFEALGIEHRLIPKEVVALRTQLENVDGVIDFSVPHGEFWENRVVLRRHLSALIGSVKQGTPFVSMSTQNAYGFKDNDIFIRSRLTDWASPYCSLKRYGERLVQRFGVQSSVPTFNLRLGQVHGFLQSVSHQFSEHVGTASSLRVFGNATDPVNTLFIQDLGEALLQIVAGQVKPGAYSVLSQPQWTQDELYQYYRNWTGNMCLIEFSGHGRSSTITQQLRSAALRWVERHRGFVDVVMLQHWPWLAAKAKGIHRARSFGMASSGADPMPERNLLGIPSLPILGDPAGTPERVLERERRMRTAWLEAIGSMVMDTPFGKMECAAKQDDRTERTA